MAKGTFARVAIFLFILPLALAACREEEQGRPLTFEKGVYGGEPDQQLSEDQFRQLNQRALKQSF